MPKSHCMTGGMPTPANPKTRRRTHPNRMNPMKKNVFTTSCHILLPVILAIALLVPKKPGQIVILILFGLWVLFLLIHNLCYRSDSVKCWFSIFGMSITIMNLFCAVYRESYKKMILLEKGTPPIIDQISIRLQCIIYVYPMFIILFLIFHRLFKKRDSRALFLFHRSRNSNHTSYCIILMMVL